MPDQLQPGIGKSCNALLQQRHFKLEIMNSPQKALSWHIPLTHWEMGILSWKTMRLIR